jgi:peptidyl-prolyl cis-trans isomerase SurA
MRRLLLGLVFFGFIFSTIAQDDRTLIKIGEDPITVDEFLAIYNKNNTNNVIDKKTMEEYVDLFVNFKLKVKEAESLGMDTAAKFVRELSGYRRQLAQPYLVDMAMTDQLIQEAYDRMQEDVAAYHVLIKVADNAAPLDTIKALKKLNALTKGVKSEADMQKLLAKVKADGDEETIAEDLGYFTAFSMVYPFENAAYKTAAGKLSKPIRTRFGYHAIFVKDKRTARGEIRVSHIMTKSSAQMDTEKAGQAKSRIDEIYEKLNQGADFSELAKQYSEDQGTAQKGGLLPWFGTGRMVDEFETVAFNLKVNGEYSAPIQTEYGWHIIRREDYRGIGKIEEEKAGIKKRIERDTRGQMGRESLLAKLKEEYSLTYNYKNRDAIHKLVTTDFMVGKWDPKETVTSDDPVFTISDNKYSKVTKMYSKADYFEFLKQTQPRKTTATMLSAVLESKWEDFLENKIIDFENENLEAKYPEFKALMQEYHDGILLFDLMDTKVWSKAVKDTTGLKAYYESNKKDFMWGERVAAKVYSCANQQVADDLTKLLKKAAKKGYSDTDVLSQINEESALNLAIKENTFSRDQDAAVDKAPWEKGMHEIAAEGDKVVVVVIEEVLEPQPKLLKEARGLVTSAYQTQLEDAWISELRNKYSFSLDQKVFSTIK